MPTELDFLEVIRANPGDDLRKLVYADWLDEQGDNRGELIRLLVEVKEQREWHEHWAAFLNSVAHNFGARDNRAMILMLEERQQRLFACQCAESVLHLLDEPLRHRIQAERIIKTARDYAYGKVSRSDLQSSLPGVIGFDARSERLSIEHAIAAIFKCASKDILPRVSRDVAAKNMAFAVCNEAAYALAIAASGDRQKRPDDQQFVWLVERHLKFKID